MTRYTFTFRLITRFALVNPILRYRDKRNLFQDLLSSPRINPGLINSTSSKLSHSPVDFSMRINFHKIMETEQGRGFVYVIPAVIPRSIRTRSVGSVSARDRDTIIPSGEELGESERDSFVGTGWRGFRYFLPVSFGEDVHTCCCA